MNAANTTHATQDAAGAWLERQLAGGRPVPASEIFRAAAADGLTQIDVSLARRHLCVVIEGAANEITWRLRAATDLAPIGGMSQSAATVARSTTSATSTTRATPRAPTEGELAAAAAAEIATYLPRRKKQPVEADSGVGNRHKATAQPADEEAAAISAYLPRRKEKAS